MTGGFVTTSSKFDENIVKFTYEGSTAIYLYYTLYILASMSGPHEAGVPIHKSNDSQYV